MNVQLIQGQFSSNDAIDIITKMIHIKIKYHENSINNSNNEEDTKNREAKIKRLQKDLFDIRKHITSKGSKINILANLDIE